MRDPSEEFYPMNIFHSRYSGTYSGGAYILIAGSYNPRKETEAVGSDPDCMSFWRTVEQEGPIIEIEVNDKTKEIYVDSGPHPAVLYQRYYEFCKDRIDENISREITETIRNYPEIEKSARENIVDLHKLNVVAESHYRRDADSTGAYLVSRELVSRFTEYDSMPSPKDLEDNEQRELREFVQELEGEIDLPLEYTWLSQ